MSKKFISLALAISMAVFFTGAPAFGEGVENIVSDDEDVTYIVEVEGDPVLLDPHTEEPQEFFLSEDAQSAIANEVNVQNYVLSNIQENVDSNVKKGYTYTMLINGFSMEGKKGDKESIEKQPGVKNVYISQIRYTPEQLDPVDEPTEGVVPNLIYSGQYTGTPYSYDQGYKGEGRAIAIIDSEFDTNHPFLSVAPTNPKYTKDDIASFISSHTLQKTVTADDVYKSAKIPFAFDYGENDNNTYATVNIHGTHVAGIAAGKNGPVPTIDTDGNIVDSDKTFSGVAPEAQLILFKATNAAGGFPDAALVAATEDASKFDVDSINLSIGSNYGVVNEKSPWNTIATNANAAGIVINISAGNAARGYNSTVPEVTKIDYSAIGDMAGPEDVFTIASVDNSGASYMRTGTLTLSDGTAIKYSQSSTSSTFSSAIGGKSYDYVYCGYGTSAEFTNATLTGKIAVISRGRETFVNMSANAAAKGAVGFILINSADNLDNSLASVSLPYAVVASSDGTKLINAETKNVAVSVLNGTVSIAFSGGGISSFSSWGIRENLVLKPDIAAPGGNIYSSLPDKKYGMMSGTSMAAPHMAGMSCLMTQYYATNPFSSAYNGLTGRSKAELLQNLLMSTANIVKNSSGVAESPRVQGAGLGNLEKAMKTPAILRAADNRTKLSLKCLSDNNLAISFKVVNLSSTEVTYDNITSEIMTDGYSPYGGKNYAGAMKDLTITSSTLPTTVTVPAASEATVSGTITISSDELAANDLIFTNGCFIDGFVSLSQTSGANPELSIPLTGFHGDIYAEKPLDKTIYDAGGSTLKSTNSTYYTGGNLRKPIAIFEKM